MPVSQVTQIITPYPTDAPQPTDSQDVFSARAFSKTVHDTVIVPQINALAGQLNTVATEVNTLAQTATIKSQEASSSASLADEWASKTGVLINGDDYSSKEYAVGTFVESSKRHASGTVATGSAKDWATKTIGEVVTGQGYGAKKYALDALQSADNANNSAIAANQAKLDAEAALDAFDDKYLGVKTDDPTLDNDGNTLQAGAFYVNSTTGFIRVYVNGVWVQGISAVAGVSSVNGLQGNLMLKTINGASVLGSGDIVIPITTVNNTLTSTSTTQALSAAMGKQLQDSKQATLVSGVTIKTINNNSLLGSGNISVDSSIIRSSRTSNTIIGTSDKGTLIDIISGTFTQTFAAAATLGNGWFCYIRNSGTGDITLDPNASETIDGLTSYIMYPGEVRLVQCDGTTLRSVVLNAFYKTFTVSGNFIKPPGYTAFGAVVIGGGAGGRSGLATKVGSVYQLTVSGSASGAAGVRRMAHSISSNLLPQSAPVVVGAGGVGGVGNNIVGGAGGESYFNTPNTLSSSSTDLPQISSLVGSGSAGGAGGSVSWTSGGWSAKGDAGANGAYIGSGVSVPSGGAGALPTGVYLQNTSGTFTYTAQAGGSTGVDFCSGAGGGSAAITYAGSVTGTINVTGGAGGNGGMGAGGGGGGHAIARDESGTATPTLNLVSGKGGDGGSGLVTIWGII